MILIIHQDDVKARNGNEIKSGEFPKPVRLDILCRLIGLYVSGVFILAVECRFIAGVFDLATNLAWPPQGSTAARQISSGRRGRDLRRYLLEDTQSSKVEK